MSEQDQHIDALLARVHPSRRAFIRQGLIGTTALALGVASSTLLAQASGAVAGKGEGKGNMPMMDGSGKGKGGMNMEGAGKGKGGMNMEGAGKGKGSGAPQ